MSTISLVLVACRLVAGSPDCAVGQRVDVPDLVWAAPVACAIAGPQLLASWQAGNPGWRAVAWRCVPTARLEREIARLEGEGV